MGVGMLIGQITPIYDIQYVADPGTDDTSPLNGQVVTVSGVVTAEYWGSSGTRTMFIQDATGPWCGIMAYEGNDGWSAFPMVFDEGVNRTTIVEGDSVTLTATVTEYYGLTELVDATALTVHGPATVPIGPDLVTSTEANHEMYEGCLLRVENATVEDPDMGYGEWSLNDGSGALVTDDVYDYYYYPTAGAGIASIEGPLTYSFGAYKLLPRIARDLVQAGPFTRTQRVQQVLGSALYMLPDSGDTDASYLVGDTVSCIGIVTVPTAEISGWDTTGGVLTGYSRFIWQDPNGGPYSSILSYFNDASAFPELYVGDSIIITGYIFEYAGGGGPAQFTEMFITEPVTIVGVFANVPEPPVIETGELQNPLTAEQYENNIVRVENATVIDNSLPYGEFLIDDDSGPILSDGDATNSMAGYDVYGNYIGGEFIIPPNGTTIASLTGYVYHAYGSFEENTTYSVRAVTPEDIVLGGGPPTITDFVIEESNLTATDPVNVSAIMTDGSAVASAVITYRVNGGAWTDVAMTAGDADVWSGTIPATNTEGAMVEYFLMASDDGGDNQPEVMSTYFPPDTSAKRYGYLTQDFHAISDVQITPLSSGQSLYDGSVVTLSGVVTTLDGASGSDFVIQSDESLFSGILCNDTSGYVPLHGDEVTVRGTVDEAYYEWEFKYGNCTVLRDIQFVEVNSAGNVINPMTVNADDLNNDSEGYESIYVSTDGPVTVTSLNSYDWTVNDGVGDFLIDDDWCDAASYDSMQGLAVDEVLAVVGGIWNYSFGSAKVQVRNSADIGVVGVADGEQLPREFDLKQNYPNPFNPSTTIEYALAADGQYALHVYDIRGALVTTLASGTGYAGFYTMVWDASQYASGLYFLRLETPEFQKTRKLLLVK